MRVCLDTNVLLQLFGSNAPLAPIRAALLAGRLELAISTEILLEYEEIVTRLSGPVRWQQVMSLLEVLGRLHGTIQRVEPTFRFGVITADPDDNKFVDCAIVAQADFVVTADRHFSALAGAGYRPQPIHPNDFVEQLRVQQKRV